MKSSYQILGILLIDDKGEFQFVPTQSVPRINVKQKQQPVLDTETGIEESLSQVDFDIQTKRDVAPTSLAEQLNKIKGGDKDGIG